MYTSHPHSCQRALYLAQTLFRIQFQIDVKFTTVCNLSCLNRDVATAQIKAYFRLPNWCGKSYFYCFHAVFTSFFSLEIALSETKVKKLEKFFSRTLSSVVTQSRD